MYSACLRRIIKFVQGIAEIPGDRIMIKEDAGIIHSADALIHNTTLLIPLEQSHTPVVNDKEILTCHDNSGSTCIMQTCRSRD